MALGSAPAFVPALVAFATFGLFANTDQPPPVPAIPAIAALGGLGLALGGGVGALAVAGAGGALAGITTRLEAPTNDATLSAEVEGTVCGRWRRRPEFASRAARFCVDWIRQGSRWLAHPPRLWLSIPDVSEPPPSGAQVRARGTVTRFPGFANLPERPPGPWRFRVKSTRLLAVTASASAVARFSNWVREAIDRRLAAVHGSRGQGVALARGLLLGDDDDLPDELRRALRRCGLAHLLAVSGFNLTLVAGLAAFAAAGARARRRALAIPALVVALYLAAVGQEPSFLRAAFMAGAALALHGVRRAGAPLQALALAALALTAFDPALPSDPGLQLSCGATGGLLLWSRRWSESFRRLPRGLAVAMGASVAAQLGALPASVAAFGELAPLAPVINLLALPWAAVATVVSLAWMLLALVSARLGAICTPLLDLLATPLAALDRLPPSLWISTPIDGGLWAGFALAGAGALVLESVRARRTAELSFSMMLLWVAPARPAAPQVEVVFADVGQGDAAIVRAGSATVIVDGGGLVGRDVGTDVLRPLLVRRGWIAIDAAVLSHPHRDHCAGLLELSRQISIGELLVAPGESGDACVDALASRTTRGLRELVAGDVWRRGNLTIETLHPASHARGTEENASSLVVRIVAGGRALLFAGDIGAAEERGLALAPVNAVSADVLKVAHHGSAGSSDLGFLRAVGARLAVVSAGASNPFGHPARATLDRLVASGATVLRTDLNGEVALAWNAGEPIRIDLPAEPRVEPPSD